MFTGIIEEIGEVVNLKRKGQNLEITLASNFADELKIDQSVAHNGVCLTVIESNDNEFTVTAINETLAKSNLGNLIEGSLINLERAMKLGDRLDGHMVQGHVDTTAICRAITEDGGSWIFTFSYNKSSGFITVEKGSVTVNGVSLTVFNSQDSEFSVAIIPYTYEHTNFKTMKIGDSVNLEFDILGKYIQKLYRSKS